MVNEALIMFELKKVTQNCFLLSVDLLNEGDDELYLAAGRRHDQRGGNPLFRADFSRAGRGNCFQNRLVLQQRYRLTFTQLRDSNGEVLSDALREAVMQGLRRVVTEEDIEVNEYDLMVSVHSNSFHHARQQSPKNISLSEW